MNKSAVYDIIETITAERIKKALPKVTDRSIRHAKCTGMFNARFYIWMKSEMEAAGKICPVDAFTWAEPKVGKRRKAA